MTATGQAPRRIGRGVAYIVASAFAFSIMSALVKAAGRHLPSQEIVGARATVSLALSYVLVRRAGLSPWGTHHGLLLFRGFIGYAALTCVFYALTRLPLADATVIQYLYPVFTAALATVFLGERSSPAMFAAGATSVAGIVLVAKPSFLFGNLHAAPAPADVAVAVLGAFLTAIAYVGVKKATALEHPLVVVFYFPLVTLPATLPAILHEGVMPTGYDWPLLAAIGIATQAGQVWLTMGIQHETATKTTALTYLQVVFAAVWGALFFGEIPDALSLVGASLVVASALLLALRKDS